MTLDIIIALNWYFEAKNFTKIRQYIFENLQLNSIVHHFLTPETVSSVLILKLFLFAIVEVSTAFIY